MSGNIIKTNSAGEGLPFLYHLSPLSSQRSLDLSHPQPPRTIDTKMSTYSTFLIKDKTRLSERIQEINEVFTENESLLPDSIIRNLSIIELKTKLWEDDFRKLRNELPNQFEAGSCTSEQGLSLMEEMKTALNKLKLELEEMNAFCKEKINIMNDLSDLGVKSLQKGASESFIVRFAWGPENAHICFLKREKPISHEWISAMGNIRRIVDVENRRNEGSKFLYVDTDLFPDLRDRPKIGLQSYKGGKLMTKGWMPPSPWPTFVRVAGGSFLVLFSVGSVITAIRYVKP